MKTFSKIGVQIPELLLPKTGIDLHKWAVIACDQYTSEPEYWQNVEQLVGAAPSTLKLVFPEVYLEEGDMAPRIAAIHEEMEAYLAQGLLEPQEQLIYLERTVGGKKRKGLMLALDLDCYDYNKGASSLIRATEGTILERLPPRMQIRRGASLESPHILVLIDDPAGTVIEPLAAAKGSLPRLYDFELMLGSGRLAGYGVSDLALESQVIAALDALAQPETFEARYSVPPGTPVFLFAMGDGNHSLATAKAVWEELKPHVGPNHSARYALVEILNVHDAGLEFEPIHRLLFGLKTDLPSAVRSYFGKDANLSPAVFAELPALLASPPAGCHRIGLVTAQGVSLLEIAHPSSNLPVGALQAFLDDFMHASGAEKLDYVHGAEVIQRLGSLPGNAGFLLPGMSKHDLFKTVILDGALPRKTFSMGEAHEKRFYMECRRIA